MEGLCGRCSGSGWLNQAAVLAAAARATTAVAVICGENGLLFTLSDAMFSI